MNEQILIYLVGVVVCGIASVCIFRSASYLFTGLIWPLILIAAGLYGLLRLVQVAESSVNHASPWKRWGSRLTLSLCVLIAILATIVP